MKYDNSTGNALNIVVVNVIVLTVVGPIMYFLAGLALNQSGQDPSGPILIAAVFSIVAMVYATKDVIRTLLKP